MANDDRKLVEEGCAMVGGDGPDSYSQNSQFQKFSADAAKGKMIEGIKNKLDLNLGSSRLNPFRIADFGCSTGPNTFFAVQNIIEAVNLKYNPERNSEDKLEFQVFFNDVTGNDFNTLFKSIPSSSSPTKYFATGVPGSFFGCLFPCSSLQIGYSSYALHWLSAVPEEVLDRSSAAWNKDSIHCTGLNPEVAKAYSRQFKKDLDTFLSARAEEIVEGGLMIMLITGVPDGVLFSQTTAGHMFNLLGSCLVDLAKLGAISEEKAESFNVPLHFTSSKELEEIIKSNGSFMIEDMESLEIPFLKRPLGENPSVSVESSVAAVRVVLEAVLKQHLGNDHAEQVDLIFQHLAEKLADTYSTFGGQCGVDQIDHFILLKRNSKY